jgi:hypothetical protein
MQFVTGYGPRQTWVVDTDVLPPRLDAYPVRHASE